MENILTNNELLGAIKQILQEATEPIKKDVAEIRDDVSKLKGNVTELQKAQEESSESIQFLSVQIDSRFNDLEKDVRVIKTTMVTKSYLDDKLLDFKAEMNMRNDRLYLKKPAAA